MVLFGAAQLAEECVVLNKQTNKQVLEGLCLHRTWGNQKFQQYFLVPIGDNEPV